MQRTSVNPWTWSLNVGYNQAEVIEGSKRQLAVSYTHLTLPTKA